MRNQNERQTQTNGENDILKIMDLDTVLKHAAEGKDDIEKGHWFTPEQSLSMILNKGKK